MTEPHIQPRFSTRSSPFTMATVERADHSHRRTLHPESHFPQRPQREERGSSEGRPFPQADPPLRTLPMQSHCLSVMELGADLCAHLAGGSGALPQHLGRRNPCQASHKLRRHSAGTRSDAGPQKTLVLFDGRWPHAVLQLHGDGRYSVVFLSRRWGNCPKRSRPLGVKLRLVTDNDCVATSSSSQPLAAAHRHSQLG